MGRPFQAADPLSSGSNRPEGRSRAGSPAPPLLQNSRFFERHAASGSQPSSLCSPDSPSSPSLKLCPISIMTRRTATRLSSPNPAGLLRNQRYSRRGPRQLGSRPRECAAIPRRFRPRGSVAQGRQRHMARGVRPQCESAAASPLPGNGRDRLTHRSELTNFSRLRALAAEACRRCRDRLPLGLGVPRRDHLLPAGPQGSLGRKSGNLPGRRGSAGNDDEALSRPWKLPAV